MLSFWALDCLYKLVPDSNDKSLILAPSFLYTNRSKLVQNLKDTFLILVPLFSLDRALTKRTTNLKISSQALGSLIFSMHVRYDVCFVVNEEFSNLWLYWFERTILVF